MDDGDKKKDDDVNVEAAKGLAEEQSKMDVYPVRMGWAFRGVGVVERRCSELGCCGRASKSSGVSDQQSVVSSLGRDTCVLKLDTYPLLLSPFGWDINPLVKG